MLGLIGDDGKKYLNSNQDFRSGPLDSVGSILQQLKGKKVRAVVTPSDDTSLANGYSAQFHSITVIPGVETPTTSKPGVLPLPKVEPEPKEPPNPLTKQPELYVACDKFQSGKVGNCKLIPKESFTQILKMAQERDEYESNPTRVNSDGSYTAVDSGGWTTKGMGSIIDPDATKNIPEAGGYQFKSQVKSFGLPFYSQEPDPRQYTIYGAYSTPSSQESPKPETEKVPVTNSTPLQPVEKYYVQCNQYNSGRVDGCSPTSLAQVEEKIQAAEKRAAALPKGVYGFGDWARSDKANAPLAAQWGAASVKEVARNWSDALYPPNDDMHPTMVIFETTKKGPGTDSTEALKAEVAAAQAEADKAAAEDTKAQEQKKLAEKILADNQLTAANASKAAAATTKAATKAKNDSAKAAKASTKAANASAAAVKASAKASNTAELAKQAATKAANDSAAATEAATAAANAVGEAKQAVAAADTKAQEQKKLAEKTLADNRLTAANASKAAAAATKAATKAKNDSAKAAKAATKAANNSAVAVKTADKASNAAALAKQAATKAANDSAAATKATTAASNAAAEAKQAVAAAKRPADKAAAIKLLNSKKSTAANASKAAAAAAKTATKAANASVVAAKASDKASNAAALAEQAATKASKIAAAAAQTAADASRAAAAAKQTAAKAAALVTESKQKALNAAKTAVTSAQAKAAAGKILEVKKAALLAAAAPAPPEVPGAREVPVGKVLIVSLENYMNPVNFQGPTVPGQDNNSCPYNANGNTASSCYDRDPSRAGGLLMNKFNAIFIHNLPPTLFQSLSGRFTDRVTFLNADYSSRKLVRLYDNGFRIEATYQNNRSNGFLPILTVPAIITVFDPAGKQYDFTGLSTSMQPSP